MNNPDNGNLRIFRYETHWVATWFDRRPGLRATHTTHPLTSGGEPETDRGPKELRDPISAQDVEPEDLDDFFASWFHGNAKCDVWIIVRDVMTPGDCFGGTLLAEGMGTLHYADNDGFAWYEGSTRKNDNPFGFTSQRKLTGVDGKRMNYNGHVRTVWGPQGGEFDEGKLNDPVKVHLH